MNTAVNQNPLTEIFGEIISSYSRSQGIEDGFLVDVTKTAQEAGITFPVALTRAAWEDCVAWTEADENRKGFTGNSENGRIWDVIFMAANAMRRSAKGGSQLIYSFYRIPREGKGRKPRLVSLKLIVGPGDSMEPVITIMQTNED
ncbi:MAG TPA: DUF6573 family protein [Bacteroidia bacterium]|nr:DUF6573 family protein [Bacteroidia bacterium]